MNKTQKAALWEAIRPELGKSWQAWNQLNQLPTDSEGAANLWEKHEQELFDMAPQLYRTWKDGKTPAQAFGEARIELHDTLAAFEKRFGWLPTAHWVAAFLGWDVDPRKVKKAAPAAPTAQK